MAVILEDDRDIRELTEVALRQSGFEVHTCSTGAERAVEVHIGNLRRKLDDDRRAPLVGDRAGRRIPVGSPPTP